MPQWSPTSPLAKVVFAAGFLYDPQQDIIYSRMDALQRRFGYAYGYDALALLGNMVIDCEPIFFDWGGKYWMIELWKGQYGLETGCEIGVYNRSPGQKSPFYAFLDATVGNRGDSNQSHNLFFDCASDKELLEMSFTLNRRGQKLFSRGPEKHWWLTGFKWGELSSPDDLSMDASIKFPDPTMSQAFVNALKGVGYQKVDAPPGGPVRFTFDKTHSHQPRSDQSMKSWLETVNSSNSAIVSTYRRLQLKSNDPNLITDQLTPGQTAAVISDAIAQYGQAFFIQVMANLAKNANQAATALLNVLVSGFGDVANLPDEAAKAITRAGYTLTEWIGSLQSALGLRLDFSCRVEINNAGNQYGLIREDFGVTKGTFAPGPCGYYVITPPEKVFPGGRARFWMQDIKPSAHGSEGWVVYYYIDSNGQKHSIRFEYGCPTGTYANYARASSSFSAWLKEGDMMRSNWAKVAQQPFPGKVLHPLTAAFIFGQNAGPPPN